MDLRIWIQTQLSQQPPQDLSSQFRSKACVAVLLRGISFETLEIAFIRRAESTKDRWSGQLAFPGGRFDESDENDFAAASREVREEIGLFLNPKDLLGRLDDLRARKQDRMLDFFIRPLVFHMRETGPLQLNPSEVAEFFWVPCAHLSDPERQTTKSIKQANSDSPVLLPAVDLSKVGPPLWGLTYLMACNLLELLKR